MKIFLTILITSLVVILAMFILNSASFNGRTIPNKKTNLDNKND